MKAKITNNLLIQNPFRIWFILLSIVFAPSILFVNAIIIISTIFLINTFDKDTSQGTFRGVGSKFSLTTMILFAIGNIGFILLLVNIVISNGYYELYGWAPNFPIEFLRNLEAPLGIVIYITAYQIFLTAGLVYYTIKLSIKTWKLNQ